MNTFLIVAGLLLLYILVQWHRSKRAKNKTLHIIDNNCTRCQKCIKWCMHKALDMTNDEIGLHITVKYPERCTACGDCVAVCKYHALELVSQKQPE